MRVELVQSVQQVQGNHATALLLQRPLPGSDDQPGPIGERPAVGRTGRDSMRREARLPVSSSVVQRDKQKTVGLGFSDLKNDEYGADDAFGNKPSSLDNLSKFRRDLRVQGLPIGINQRADPSGAIQPIFTAGIKQAMRQALTIKSNLAGFTQEQINFARSHPPRLKPDELALAKQYALQKQQMIKNARGVPVATDIDYTGTTAEEWFAMKDVPKSAGGWPPALAAISVWELSHLLHNQELFDKTEFYYYDASAQQPRTARLTADELNTKGVLLAPGEWIELRELVGEDPPEESSAISKWFKRIFSSCISGQAAD